MLVYFGYIRRNFLRLFYIMGKKTKKYTNFTPNFYA